MIAVAFPPIRVEHTGQTAALVPHVHRVHPILFEKRVQVLLPTYTVGLTSCNQQPRFCCHDPISQECVNPVIAKDILRSERLP